MKTPIPDYITQLATAVEAAGGRTYFVGGVVMLASFFVPDQLPAHSGWTSYVPLATLSSGPGQTFWLVGMIFLITSSLLGSTNIIVIKNGIINIITYI